MTVETDMFALERSRQRLRSGPEAKAIDMWVRQALSDRFDETLVETLPGELTTLALRFSN
jgi:hypothetical protein